MALLRRSRAVRTALTLVCAAGIFAALAVLYGTDVCGDGGFIPCPFHLLTGLDCPGCGGTRALWSLLHLRVADALGYNAALTLLFPALALYAAGLGASYSLYGKDAVTPKLPAALLWAVLAGLFLFGALRNIPAYPFSLLAA